MIESVIYLLIYLCIVAIVIYLIIYVLGIIGVPLPAKVIQLLWVIFGLIALLFIVRILLGSGGLKLGKLTMGAIPLLT